MTRLSAAIFGCEGLRLTAEEKVFFSEVSPFGFILFARNIDSGDQIRALCDDLRGAVGWAAPIFIDQEGGRVQRLRAPLVTDWLPPLDDVARYGANAPHAMRLRAQILGLEQRAFGIDGNCAPMLDVARAETHPFLRNRCYGETVETVVEVGLAVQQGLMDAGVLPVIKHIPGHGLAQLDSHLDLPRISADVEALDRVDFAAFKPFATAPLGMTAHLVFEQIDPQPATISSRMIDLIRSQIGFQGLLMTDDIGMEALSGTPGERARASLEAGCDVVLHCNGKMPEMCDVAAHLHELQGAARNRADQALAARQTPLSEDIAALHDALAEVTPLGTHD
jgi:beta-N-acetylhexosaminidase